MRHLLNLVPESEPCLVKTAEWVRRELSVRLAHRLFDFHRLPFAVLGNPNVRETYELYVRTFRRIKSVDKIGSMDEQKNFLKLLQSERDAHDKSGQSFSGAVYGCYEHGL
eukprot:GHVT01064559.1.p1 GENE.GHVT01064559.1~~GHVT01064559.1.p1  ORF type:complete len:110 (-),score=6.60 GHVT01064559.1:315-644(-)